MADLTEVGVHLQVQGALESTADLNRVGDAAARTAAQLRLLGAVDVQVAIRNTSDGMRQASSSASGLGSSLSGLDRQLRSVSGSFGDFVGNVTKYGTLAFAGVTLAVGGFGLAAASSFENSRIAFGALLGDVQKGNDLFKQLQAFNLKTPFDLPQINQAAQTLLNYGISEDKLLPLLTQIANVASTAPGQLRNEYLQRDVLAIGQISQNGLVQGQDIRQLVQSGFPIQKLLQEATGQTGQQVQAAIHGGGGLNLQSSTLLDLITSGKSDTLSNYQGAADAASKSLSGQFSNFKDIFTTDLAGAASPLADQVKTQTLPALTGALDTFLKVAGPPLFKVIADLANGLTALLPIIQPVLVGFADGLDQLFHSAGPVTSSLQPLGEELGGAIEGFFASLAKQMPVLVPALVDLAKLMPAFVDALAQLVPLVTPLLKLFDGLLSLSPVRSVVGGLLVGLLAYNALSGTVRTVGRMATALNALTDAQQRQAFVGRYGTGARVGAGALGAVGLGASVVDAANNGLSAGNILGSAGSGALLGATLGSVIPGVGTALGAASGALIGGGAAVIGAQLHHTTNVHPGAIQVVNPQSDADITAAVDAGIRRATEAQARRGTN